MSKLRMSMFWREVGKEGEWAAEPSTWVEIDMRGLVVADIQMSALEEEEIEALQRYLYTLKEERKMAGEVRKCHIARTEVPRAVAKNQSRAIAAGIVAEQEYLHARESRSAAHHTYFEVFANDPDADTEPAPEATVMSEEK